MPDTNTVHFDVALTNVSIAYRNQSLVARDIAPEVAVRRQSDRYFIYDSERESFRETFDGRAPGTEAAEVDFQLSNDSYFCDDHALESSIPDEERLNADAPLQPEIDRVEFLSDKILLNQEINLAGKLTDLATMPGIDVNAGGLDWDDDTLDPVATVETGREAILAGTQQLPNTLVLSQAAYNAARNNAKVIERLKYSGLAVVGADVLAQVLDVDRVLVARAVKNTAQAGQPATMAPIWGKDAVLMYVPPRVSLKSLAPVLTFAWSQANGSSRGYSVQTWREERRKATMVRVQKYYDQKIVASPAAYLLKNVAV